jgi:predicted KAP-like P-loop ATPase
MPMFGIPGGLAAESFGGAVHSAAEVVRQGHDALEAKGAVEAKSLEELKQELAGLLENLPRPILVVIDDIDRLSTAEILEIFQLVKANADFPRIIYLLLFEREVVSKALNQISGDKGDEFLEKIVQVGYHIPHASKASVQKVLFDGLNKHLEHEAVSKHWDKERWGALYSEGISSYFRNLRQVYRFLGSFSFHALHHRRGKSFEVNPVDLIGLEALRVFEPSVYERLPGAKTILTRHKGLMLFGEIKQEVIEEAISQILSAASSETRGQVSSVLHNLFPPLLSAFSGEGGVSRHRDEWLREARICHPDLFDKYFTLVVADDDLSQAELDELIECSADGKRFETFCQALESRNLLKTALDRLDAFKGEIPLENMPALIEGLCNIADRFPPRVPAVFGTDMGGTAWRLVYFGLRREPDAKKRFEVLSQAFARSAGIALQLMIVDRDERIGDRSANGHQFLTEEGDLKILKDRCVSKLRAALARDEFKRSPRIQQFLWRLGEWASISEVQAWIKTQLVDGKSAAWLLSILLSEIYTSGPKPIRYLIQLSEVERFSDIPSLKRLIEELPGTALTKKEARAVEEFHKALKWQQDGKTEADWHHSQDGFGEEIRE